MRVGLVQFYLLSCVNQLLSHFLPAAVRHCGATQILSHDMTEHTPGTHFTLNVPARQTSHTHSHIYLSTLRECACAHLKCVSSRTTQRLVSVTVGPSNNNITEHTPRPGRGAIPIRSNQHTMTRHRKNSSSPQLRLVAKK